jgi:hypothetical protein
MLSRMLPPNHASNNFSSTNRTSTNKIKTKTKITLVELNKIIRMLHLVNALESFSTVTRGRRVVIKLFKSMEDKEINN